MVWIQHNKIQDALLKGEKNSLQADGSQKDKMCVRLCADNFKKTKLLTEEVHLEDVPVLAANVQKHVDRQQ